MYAQARQQTPTENSGPRTPSGRRARDAGESFMNTANRLNVITQQPAGDYVVGQFH